MKNLFSPLMEEVNLGEARSPVNSWHAIKKPPFAVLQNISCKTCSLLKLQSGGVIKGLFRHALPWNVHSDFDSVVVLW